VKEVRLQNEKRSIEAKLSRNAAGIRCSVPFSEDGHLDLSAELPATCIVHRRQLSASDIIDGFAYDYAYHTD
jgi:hypothetical protein